MDISTLLADPVAFSLECIKSAPKLITLIIKAVQPKAECPRCHYPSTRIHSRYVRTVADLPWHGIAVRLELHARRFRCTHDLCSQRIFCEHFPQTVQRYARKTARLNDALQFIGFIIGGEAGARTARRLGLSVSPDTLIRRVRQAVLPQTQTPRVLGVDDWAKRKGKAYGTILVDLEQRRPVDLLQDREAATLAAWLKAHPGVQIVTRDRARAYAEGITAGAPEAVQVADRWHIIKNLAEAFERLLTRQHQFVRAAVRPATELTPLSPSLSPEVRPSAPPVPTLLPPAPARPGVAERRERSLALYNEAIKFKREGLSAKQIAPLVGQSARTVYRWLQQGELREPTRCRRSALDAHLPYITARWQEGCRNASELWRELVARGYRGSSRSVNNYLHRKPAQLQAPSQCGKRAQTQPAPPLMSAPSPRRAVWLLLKPEGLNEVERQVSENLCRLAPEIAQATELVRRFMQMVRGRQADQLNAWIAEVAGSQLPELKAFARGLEQDRAVVEAALSSVWSNGQTEGQVHRLKLLKRQMYGRAKFDLLRAKVLFAP